MPVVVAVSSAIDCCVVVVPVAVDVVAAVDWDSLHSSAVDCDTMNSPCHDPVLTNTTAVDSPQLDHACPSHLVADSFADSSVAYPAWAVGSVVVAYAVVVVVVAVDRDVSVAVLAAVVAAVDVAAVAVAD